MILAPYLGIEPAPCALESEVLTTGTAREVPELSFGCIDSPWHSEAISSLYSPCLEKEMATHSSVLAWRIPGTGEPGGLPSMGSHRVGHD